MASNGNVKILVGAGIGVGALLLFAGGAKAASVALPKGKGGRGLRYPKEGSNPADEESLARVIASEAGSEPAAIQMAVAFATKNAARRAGTSITGLVKTPGNVYGPQSRGSYASTARAASQGNRVMAAQVLRGAVKDPTQGAVQYDSPRAQRALLKRKATGYKMTPEQVAANRRKEGKRLVLVPGVPEERFRMWAAGDAFAATAGLWSHEVHGALQTGMVAYA